MDFLFSNSIRLSIDYRSPKSKWSHAHTHSHTHSRPSRSHHRSHHRPHPWTHSWTHSERARAHHSHTQVSHHTHHVHWHLILHLRLNQDLFLRRLLLLLVQLLRFLLVVLVSLFRRRLKFWRCWFLLLLLLGLWLLFRQLLLCKLLTFGLLRQFVWKVGLLLCGSRFGASQYCSQGIVKLSFGDFAVAVGVDLLKRVANVFYGDFVFEMHGCKQVLEKVVELVFVQGVVSILIVLREDVVHILAQLFVCDVHL